MYAVYLPVLLKNFKPNPTSDPHADSVVVGITLTCVVLLFLITLTAAGYHFVYKSSTVKKAYLWYLILTVHRRALQTINSAIHI